ncbi:MAG: hypothetical protein GYA24_03285 [Candidatus Lokiarchaeota archaeon]|nr:hypothetical protein [Candidatus Lokiarchaeota archaeon]
MAILIRRPTLLFRLAPRRTDTFTGEAQVARASLLRAVSSSLALCSMGKIRVHSFNFATTPAATRCIVKALVPRSERQRFIVGFGGHITTTTHEGHPVSIFFMEF